jgi:hypothetical protein
MPNCCVNSPLNSAIRKYPNDVAIAKRCASFPFQALIVANANPLGATGPDG